MATMSMITVTVVRNAYINDNVDNGDDDDNDEDDACDDDDGRHICEASYESRRINEAGKQFPPL